MGNARSPFCLGVALTEQIFHLSFEIGEFNLEVQRVDVVWLFDSQAPFGAPPSSLVTKR